MQSQLAVWDLRTGEELQTISCVFHGPISCIVWISREEREVILFAFGCADGSVHIYQRHGRGVRLIDPV